MLSFGSIWPSAVRTVNVGNGSDSPPSLSLAVVSSDSESDSEFSSSSLDDKSLPGGSKGLKIRKHQAESGEESAVTPECGHGNG